MVSVLRPPTPTPSSHLAAMLLHHDAQTSVHKTTFGILRLVLSAGQRPERTGSAADPPTPREHVHLRQATGRVHRQPSLRCGAQPCRRPRSTLWPACQAQRTRQPTTAPRPRSWSPRALRSPTVPSDEKDCCEAAHARDGEGAGEVADGEGGCGASGRGRLLGVVRFDSGEMPAEDSFLRAAGADIVRAPEVPAARAGRRASRAGAPSRTTSWSARRRSGVSRRTLVMRWRRRRCRWGCRRLSSEGLSEDGRQRLRVIRQLAEHVVARMGAMAAAAWTRVASGLGALWK